MLKNKVLEFLQKIPQNKVVTYKYLAKKFNTHPRAIAVFMKYNKFPDVFPCYKVIAANGDIGGYSGVGGIDDKIRRLKKDGIEIRGKKIDKKYIYNEE